LNRTIRWAAGLAALLALGGADCRPWSPSGRLERGPAGPGLVQSVRIEPAEPREGETIRIVSEVTNRSSRTIRATFTDCGLGLTGSLALAQIPGTVRCLSVSYERELAPGESIVGGDAMMVKSSPGDYRLEVLHLIGSAPRAGIDVRVVE